MRRKWHYLKKVTVLGLCLVFVQILLSMHGGAYYRNSMYSLSETIYLFANGTFRAAENSNLSTKAPLENVNQTSKIVLETPNPPLLEGRHEGHQGFALAAAVKETCKAIKEKGTAKFFSMFGFVDKRLLYCPVEKCATTFWRRTFHLLTYKGASPYSNPYAVPLSRLPTINKGFTAQTVYRDSTQDKLVRKNSFTFLIVRNPYSRMFSAFVDKLVPPNPYFWKALGAKSILMFRKNPSVKSKTVGYDVTFAEYARYVIKSMQTKRDLDPHHIPIFDKCRPCDVEFDYIGKMESFADDSMYIFKKMNMTSTVKTFSSSKVFKDMSADDALEDTTTSPFSWKKEIMRTISWETALKRTWLKLYIRGIVDMDQKFEDYVPKEDIDKLTADEFKAIAYAAKAVSDPVKLKAQKSEAMREAFLTLHLHEVKTLRELYKHDLNLFEYEESPTVLFDRPDEPQNATKYFNYMHWT